MSSKLSQCLQNCLNVNNYINDLKIYLQNVCENAVGLKEAKAPFNDHKDLMRRLILEMFSNTSNNQSNYKTTSMVTTVKLLLESATDLPPMDADGLCDPYVKIYIRGSKTKPIKSTVIYKTLNPIWNEVFHITIDKKQTISNQEICIEVWDKDPSSLIEVIRECREIKSCSHFWNGLRDFSELIVSYILWTDVDDKIGSVNFSVNDIPCFPRKEVKEIKDDYGRVYGSLCVSLDWGTNIVPDKKAKKEDESEKKLQLLDRVSRQMQVYSYFLSWHLKHQSSSNLPDEEILTYYTFLYSPAVSLVNQSRICCNFSVNEDNIIRHLVIFELICSKNTNEKEKLILLIILCNEGLSLESEKWAAEDVKDFNQELDELELSSFKKVFKTFESNFNQLLEDKDSNTILVRQLLLCLKICSRFDTKYPQAHLMNMVNTFLSDIVIRFCEQRFSTSHWSSMTDALELLNDRLTKFWVQNLGNILEKDKKYKIQSLFMKNWKPAVFEMVKIWIENWKSFTFDSHTIFFRLYKTIRSLDFILSGTSVQDVYFPTLLGHIKELRFGTLFLTTRSNYKMGFRKLFSNEIFERFINDRKNEIPALCNKMVEERIAAVKQLLDKKDVKMEELSEDETFYKICGYNILLYDTFQYWSIELFDLSLVCCLDSIKEYCTLYVNFILNSVSTLKEPLRGKNISNEFQRQLLVIGLNDLYQMSIVNLRQVLIERLTDRKAEEIWSVFHSFLQKHSEVNNLASECKWKEILANDLFAYNKEQSDDRSNEYLCVVRCLVQIEQKLTEITQLKNTLTHPLTNIIFTKFRNKIKQLMEEVDISKWDNLLESFAEYLTNELNNAIKEISSRKTKCDILSECEHRLNYLLETNFKELHFLWKKQRKEVKRIRFRILMLKWETLFRKAFEVIAVIIDNLADSCPKIRNVTVLSETYFESEEYHNFSKEIKGEK